MAARSPTRIALVLGVVTAVSFGLAVLLFEQLYADRVYPGVAVESSFATTDLGGRTREQAAQALIAEYDRYLRAPLVLRYLGREWPTSPRGLGARLDADAVVSAAWAHGRNLTPLGRLRLQLGGLGGAGTTLPPPTLAYDEAKLRAFVTGLTKDVERPPALAEMTLRGDGALVVLPSQLGAQLNVARTTEAVRAALSSYSTAPIDVVVDDVAPGLTEADLTEVKLRAERILARPLTLQVMIDGAAKSWTLDRPALAELVELHASAGSPPRLDLVVVDDKIRRRVERIAPEIEKAPKNARFGLEASELRVLRDSEDGRRLEINASVERIHAALLGDERVVTLPWQPVRPRFSSADLAALQFPDMIERASTVYGGTLPERMHNVELATERINGVVIGPGDSFSFNDEVGEVSYRSGYKKGYGISQDGENVVTIPSEGGGICQVATTLFQSVFWAGYPVIERNWHLYWIPRYGQRPRGLKGLDATIDQVYDKDHKLLYAVDLRWRNNTEAPVLLVAEADGKDVTVALWGRKPDWQVKVAEPKIDKLIKADTRTVRQVDPTLAPGAQLMVERAEDGFQATIARTIVHDGKILDEQRFVSTYRPSRNVLLVGAQPAKGTPTAGPRRAEDRPATPVPISTGRSVITPLPSVEPTRTPVRTPTRAAQPARTPTAKATVRASPSPTGRARPPGAP